MRNAIKMLGLVFVLALSACGSEKSDNLAQFIGTWRATAGTTTVICPGYAPFTGALSGNAVWSEGVSSDLLLMNEAIVTCPIMADVTKSTASGVPGQTCTEPDGAGGTSIVSFSSYTFVIAPDGQTASENSSGQVTYVVDGASVVCTFNETGSHQKIGN